MKMRIRTHLLVFAFFYAQQALASALPLKPNCDTIFTKDGKSYVVQIVQIDSAEVEYYLCDSDNLNSFKLRAVAIERIGYSPQSQRNMERSEFRADPAGKLSYSAMILVMIGVGCIALLGIYGLALGLPLMVFGVLRAERALRRLKKKPKRSFDAKTRKLAYASVVIGQGFLILTAFLAVMLSWVLG